MPDGLKELLSALAFGGAFLAIVLIGFAALRWADRDWYKARRRGRRDAG
jgi:hypothetical protein